MTDNESNQKVELWNLFLRVRGSFAQISNARAHVEVSAESDEVKRMVEARAFLGLSAKMERRQVSNSEEVAQLMAEAVAELSSSAVKDVINASSIVIAHSILDDAVFSLLSFTRENSPKDWMGSIESSKVTLKDAVSDIEAEICSLLDKKLKNIERESLEKKINTLHLICSNSVRSSEISYDAKKLRELDELRHRIVHRVGSESVSDCEAQEAINAFDATVFYLMDIVADKYSLDFP